MTNEQQHELEVIRARRERNYMAEFRMELIDDIDTLLRMIDQQQAVIDAARSVRRIPAHKDGPGHDMALESLYDALDALNGTEPDAAG